MFAISPKTDCPHVRAAVNKTMPDILPYGAPCCVCHDTSENWVCATCFAQNCSRYVKGHASKHYEQTHHPVALSFSDLSFWCYACESYIEHRTLRPLGNLARDSKFSTPPPMTAHVAPQAQPTVSGKITTVCERRKELQIADCTLPDILLFKNCTQSVMKLTSGELADIGFTQCDQCHFILKVKVASGKLHMLACSDVHVDMNHTCIPHVVMEDCKAINIVLSDEWSKNNGLVVTKCCVNVKIKLPGTTVTLPPKAESGAFVFQWKEGSQLFQSVEDFESLHGPLQLGNIFSTIEEAASIPAPSSADAPVPAPLPGFHAASSTSVPPTSSRTGYGHATDEEVIEYFDTPAKFETKIQQLIQLVKDSSYVVVYTGAGISTSARIPDYRGPQGVWTMRDKGLSAKMDITLEEAKPTPAHMAIAELVNRGIVKYVVSTNVDGLHRRSGIPADKISELHGNCYIEHCNKCKTEYIRTFDVSNAKDATLAASDAHATGRKCEKSGCDGYLRDNIINFGESLPVSAAQLAVEESNKADLALVLGTSMRVHPACDMPLLADNLVICNLQKTPFDERSKINVFERTDKVMEKLMAGLEIPIPPYTV